MFSSNHVHAIGGRVVKWKGRVASIAPALASVSVVALMATGAFGTTFATSVTGTAEHVIADDQEITILDNVWVRLDGGNAGGVIHVTDTDYTGLVTNDGTIAVAQTTGTGVTGIWLADDLGGSIVNNGDINIVLQNNSADATASGIYIGGDVNGSIANSSTGAIDVSVASDSYNATGYGIYIDGGVGGSGVVSNAGEIDVYARADASSVYASAYGIYVDADMNGTISNTNSGTITATATSASSGVSAYGIYIGGDLNGTIDNAGTISATALSVDSDGSAYGVYISGSVTQTAQIMNSGKIQATTVVGSSYAYAEGIYVFGSLDGTIVNSGEIVASVTDSYYAYGYGIAVSGAVTGVITNAGSITVTAETTSSGYTAQAYGIWLGDDLTGSITNTGTIKVTADSPDYDAFAYGVRVGGNVTGSITNAGTIMVSATAGTSDYYSSAYAYGIVVNGAVGLGGSIVNSGRMEISAEGVGSTDASAYGIWVKNDLLGTISNSGEIVASAIGDKQGADGRVYGIEVGDLNDFRRGQQSIDADVYGSISNSGTITVNGYNYYETGSAWGILVNGALNGTIENSGTISVKGESVTDDASAWGIYIRRDVGANGLINVSGLIEVKAKTASDDALAYGIAIGGPLYDNNDTGGVLDGTIDVSGTISVSSEATTDKALAYGIYVDEVGGDGLISVSGLIEAKALTVSDSATAYGIYVSNTINGNIVVSGTIDAQARNNSSSNKADGRGIDLHNGNSGSVTITSSGVVHAYAENKSDSNASATGIYSAGTSGTIENNGLISVEAYGTGFAYAQGINANGAGDGSVSNSGTITVQAHGSYGSAYGLVADSVGTNGTVSNSGSIDVSAFGTNGYDAYGVYLTSFGGQFINTGSIVATAGDDIGTAIYASGGGGLVTLNTKGFIIGNIHLNGDVDLNVQGAVGRSVHWIVDEFNYSGVIDVNGDGDLGTTVFYDGDATVEFATLDSSGLVAVRQANADAGFLGIDTLVSKTAAAAANPVKAADAKGGTHLMPFVAAASQNRTYSATSATLAQDVSTASVSFGNTMALQNGMFLGLGGGKLSGSADVTYMGGPSSKADQQGAFLGVALSGSFDKVHFAAAISAGRMQVDTTRFVNDNTVFDGIVSEAASVDSTFMAAEVAVSGHFDIGHGMAVVPNSVIKYAQHHVDGYSETGSGAAADVGAQKFGAFEGEVGLGLEKTLGHGVLSGGISLMSRSVSGGEQVSVTMIGDTQTVDATIASLNAKKLSLGYAASFSAAGQFNLGYETLIGSDALSGGKISGQLRFSF